MITEIISGLWITNYKEIKNDQFFKDNSITLVIYCVGNEIPFYNVSNVRNIRIPVSPFLHEDDISFLKKNSKQILLFIYSMKDSHNILLCGYENYTVPSIIMGIYMIQYGNIDSKQILDIIQSKNKDTIIDINLTHFLGT